MKALYIVLGIIGLVFLMAAFAAYYGFVLATLWAWFAVPLGAIKIGYLQAYGLSLIPAVLLGTRGLNFGKKTTEETVAAVIFPAVALLFGYIAVSFI